MNPLFPSTSVESVFSIDYQKLKAMGYKAIIFDIDSTLVPHGDDTTNEIDQLFKHFTLHSSRPILSSHQVCVVSGTLRPSNLTNPFFSLSLQLNGFCAHILHSNPMSSMLLVTLD